MFQEAAWPLRSLTVARMHDSYIAVAINALECVEWISDLERWLLDLVLPGFVLRMLLSMHFSSFVSTNNMSGAGIKRAKRRVVHLLSIT